MTCTVPPFVKAVLEEADRIEPNRRTSSDGGCASQAHHAQNPDSDHEGSGPHDYCHAVDVSVDPPRFDPRDYLEELIRRRDPRIKYIVANFSGWNGRPNTLPDVICGPETGWLWVQNGSFKRDHAESPHVHYSFWPSAEYSTAAFFIAASAPLTPPPAPVTTDLGAAAVKITDISMNLDAHGNGHVPVAGVKAGQVLAVTGIATPSPEKIGGYRPLPTVNLTIGKDTFAEVVVEGGAPHDRATVRVAHT